MRKISTGAMLVAAAAIAWAQSGQEPQGAQSKPATMTKMVVRLTGPGVRTGSFAALPKTIYRAGEHYARIEDPPDARLKIEKLTIIAEPDAYSVNLIDRKGTHARDTGGAGDLHLPVVLPFDPKRKLGTLDRLEFGDELEFFKDAGAEKKAGPIINAQPTDAYELPTPAGPATLVVRSGTEIPVTLSWHGDDGVFRYEYISYQDMPFQPGLFGKPKGITLREIPSDNGTTPS